MRRRGDAAAGRYGARGAGRHNRRSPAPYGAGDGAPRGALDGACDGPVRGFSGSRAEERGRDRAARDQLTETDGSPEAMPSFSICSAIFIASSMRVSTIFDSGTVLMTSPLTKI